MPLEEPRSRLGAWATAMTLAALIVLFQRLAPPGASVILPHLVLTAQAVWFLGGRTGLAVSLTTVVVSGWVAYLGPGGSAELVPSGIQLWNVTSRLLSAAFVAFVLVGLRQALEVEHWRASTDQLTGALNRRAFEERLDRTIRRADATSEAVVLAFMDLDGFKAVNDRHGHAAGNRVLAAFARAAASAIRPGDHFARVGGDEFAAVLTVANCLEGDHLAELLHRRLSQILSGTGFPVTCSMGALVMDAHAMLVETEVMEQADRLMYVAKESGKDALHIGRGERLEEILRAAFPVSHEEPPPAMAKVLRWADHAKRVAGSSGGG